MFSRHGLWESDDCKSLDSRVVFSCRGVAKCTNLIHNKPAWLLYIDVELGYIRSWKIDPEIELLDGIFGGSEKQAAPKALKPQQSSSTSLVLQYIVVVARAENSLLVS